MHYDVGTMPSARLLRSVACLLLSFIVLGYLGLVEIGRWQLDEYVEFYRMRSMSPGHYLADRLTWSPRPISETLYCSYGWLVNHFHHQFIVPLLGGLWLLFLAAGLLTYWRKRRQTNAEIAGPGLLIALTLLSLSLAGGHTTEVFYWPAGAVAYLPTLAATLLVFLLAMEGQLDLPSGRFIASICLIVAGGSSEAGAVFAISYAFLQIFQWVRSAVGKGDRPGKQPFLWFLAPLVVALPVLFMARQNRFHTPPPDAVAGIAGHPVASAIASIKELAFEVLGRSMLAGAYHTNPHPGQWLHMGSGFLIGMFLHSRILMQALLLIGVALCLSLSRPSRRLVNQVLEVVGALVLASFLTVVAANLHFGTSCCERHELLRESWMTMILTGVAIACLGWISEERRLWLSRHRAWAPLVLVLAVISLGCLGPLYRTYRDLPQLKTMSDENAESGFQLNSDRMVFSILPAEGIVNEEPIPPGDFARPPVIQGFSYDVYPYYLLGFFDKQAVVIRPGDVSGQNSSVTVPAH